MCNIFLLLFSSLLRVYPVIYMVFFSFLFCIDIYCLWKPQNCNHPKPTSIDLIFHPIFSDTGFSWCRRFGYFLRIFNPIYRTLYNRLSYTFFLCFNTFDCCTFCIMDSLYIMWACLMWFVYAKITLGQVGLIRKDLF